MNTTTLRGIFPEPKPVHRRNFMKENIKQLKALQGIQRERKITSSSSSNRPNKYKNIPSRVYANLTAQSKSESLDKYPKQSPVPNRPIFKRTLRSPWTSSPDIEQKNQSVQTEREENVSKLYETGKIKYPTPAMTPHKAKATPKPKNDSGDADKIAKDMEKLDLDDKQNYIKQNIKNIKPKVKPEAGQDPLQPPPTYQKGVVPKYLKEKKTEDVKAAEYEGENMTGLVLLPDEERKEYLRVARENYAALIKELNAMPMRNDTLKKRKRKMEIEEELKRLDEVIKIFQKPKVFVKADG